MAALHGKPVRIYVGDKDSFFREMAEEQFGHGGTVMSPSQCGSEIVHLLLGVGHEQLSGLELNDMCDWMSTLEVGNI